MPIFFFVVLLRGLWLVHSTSETRVWGELHRTVTLPCSFIPGEEEVIHWIDKDKKTVHSYYRGKDQLDNQDKHYSGRTTLFLNEVRKGNASLQLRDLKISNENTYSFYVGTTRGRTDGTVTLQIADFNHSIDYKWVDDKLHLNCNVNNVYPDDTFRITWYVDNVKTNKSFHTVTNTSLSHHCVIRHSVVESTWTGNWKRKERIEKKGDNLTCVCTVCKTLKTDILSIYLMKNKTEQVIVAFTNNTTEGDYGNRVHVLEDHSLYLSNLSMTDNGDYFCVIKTAKQMDIEMTSVNITEKEEKDQSRHHWTPIGIIILVVLLLVICHVCKKKILDKKN